ncbi:hypothetical protein R3I94_007959 [Phoxinus phoxinus]
MAQKACVAILWPFQSTHTYSTMRFLHSNCGSGCQSCLKNILSPLTH